MPEEQVVELDVGCRPEAAVSGGLLIQTESEVHLLFNAMSLPGNAIGQSVSLGAAAIAFKRCALTRFGDPNDEGRMEHVLYDKGLRNIGYAVCEVLHSRWAKEEMDRQRATIVRIWGGRGAKTYEPEPLRHFLVSFHDSTFECLATDWTVVIRKESVAMTAKRILGSLER